MEMTWSSIVSVAILTAVNMNLAAIKTEYKPTDLCPFSGTELQQQLRKIYNNRPQIELMDGTNSAAIVYHD